MEKSDSDRESNPQFCQILERRSIFENQYVRLYSALTSFGTVRKEYFVSDYGERVGTLVLAGEKILLVEQYRFLLNQVSREIPGGRVEQGETAEAAARRECLEEAGVRCISLHPLLSYSPGCDVLANLTHLFYTHEFEEKAERKSQETVGSIWMSFGECMQMILSGQIVDGLTIMALLAYKIRRTSGDIRGPSGWS